MANLSLNFTTRANTAPLVSSLHQVRSAANQAMGGMQTGAIRVEAPLNRLNKQIQAGRLSWRDLSRTMRNSSRILAENNALLNAQARSYIDASGNARVYLNVVRGVAANQATLNQRLRLGVTALKAFGAQTIATGKNVQWAGRQVMIGLSLPLIALAAAATRGAEEYDKQMTRIVKVTNLSAVGMQNSMGEFVETFQAGTDQMQLAIDSIERQSDRLAGIGASMGFMANETSQLAAEFSQMGFAGFALDGVTESALRLARVSGTDLPDAMNLTRLSVMAFGKELGDGPGGLTETFARLNMIENRTSLSLREMAGAIPIVAGVAKNLSIEIETLGGMLALMKDKGIEAREGATSLRTGLIRLVQDATDPAIAAFEKLNINILELQEMNRGNVFGLITDLSHILFDLQNSGEQAAEKTELFIAAIGKMVGTRAAARFTSMLEGIGRDIEQYTEVVNGFEVTQFKFVEGVDEAGDAFRALSPALMDSNIAMRQFLFEENRVNESLAGTAEILRAEINLELRRFGRQLLPLKNAVMKFGRDLIRSFNNLSDSVRNSIIVFSGLVAILGPATMIFGVMLNAFGQIISLFARMLPGIKLTTAAIEAEKKAFDRSSASIIQATSSKQAMIQTNGALAASANAVTAAVTTQASAYAALGAALAGTAGRAGGAAGAVAVGRAGRATRTAAVRRDPQTGQAIRDDSGNVVLRAGTRLDPKTGQYIATTRQGTTARGAAAGREPTRTSRGEAITTAAVLAGMSIPAIMSIPARQRFNPTLGMAQGHAEVIRQMLTRDVLIRSMGPEANVQQLMSRQRGGMAPIDAIRQFAFREAIAGYEREAAKAVAAGRGVPSVQEYMRNLDQERLVRSATLRAGTEGIVDPRGNVRFAPQPQGIREMAGFSGRAGARDIVRLTPEQRNIFRSQYGVDIGRRASVGQIESSIRAARGSTAAFEARNMLDDMIGRGEVRTTRATMTRQDLIRQDLGFVRREVESAVADRRIADTPEDRRRFAREITPERARGGVEGERAMRRDRAVGARETLLGKRAPQTAVEKGISFGRNAALMAMFAPFKLIAQGLKMLTTSAFGLVPVFKALGNVIRATTMPAMYLLGNALLTLAGSVGTLIGATVTFGKTLLGNMFGRAGGVAARAAHAFREGPLRRMGARRQLDMAGRRTGPGGIAPLTSGPRSAPPGAFVPAAYNLGGARSRGLFRRGVSGMGRAGSAIGRGALGALSMVPGLGILGRIGRNATSNLAPTLGGRIRAATAMDPTVTSYRQARDAALARRTQMGGAAGPILPGQAAGARSSATRLQRGRAVLSGVRGAMIAKGGIGGFAAGSVLGAAATLAVPILLTLGAAAIANPADFKKALEGMFGPTLETIKRLWDDVSSAFVRLFDIIRGGEGDSEGFGSTLAKWAGILTGLIGGTLGNVLAVALGLVQGIVNALSGVFLFLKGDGAGAAQAFGMAWRNVWGSLLEAVSNFFDMLREIPLIGGIFGWVSDLAGKLAEETNNTAAAMALIPDSIAEINKNLREVNNLTQENRREYEQIGKILQELADFEIINMEDINRLVEMVEITEDMTDEQIAAGEARLDNVYNEIAAMEHLTDEQQTQIAQYVVRQRLEGRLGVLRLRFQELSNDLQEVEENGHDHIISQRVAQLRLAQLQANIEAELAKEVGNRNMAALAGWQREANAIEASNRQRVSREGLERGIAEIAEEILEIEQEMLAVGDEVNSQLSLRTQRMNMAREATAQEADEMERLADEAERAKAFIQALRGGVGEVMGDIQSVLNDIISSQRSFVSNFYDELTTSVSDYFSNFQDMFDDQTDYIIEELEARAQYEIDLIDDITDAAIEKIEEEIAMEDRLEKQREDFFRRERARIDFLSSRREGEIRIQEELLRGNIAEAAILQVQQRASSQEFYSNIVQDREAELKDMRNQARNQRIEELDFEREIFNQRIEEDLEAAKEAAEETRDLNNEQANASLSTAQEIIKNARDASAKAVAAEEQRIENYLREWKRITPATEEEFRRHTQALQKFMTESGARLQEEINNINQGMRDALGELDEDFKDSVNSQSESLSEILEESRFALGGIYEAVKITSENSLIAMLSMVDGFVDGLTSGFMRGEDLLEQFAEKFERELIDSMKYAAEVAAIVLGESEKWEAAGQAAADKFRKPMEKMLADIESRIAQANRAMTDMTGFMTFPSFPSAIDRLTNADISSFWGGTRQFNPGATADDVRRDSQQAHLDYLAGEDLGPATTPQGQEIVDMMAGLAGFAEQEPLINRLGSSIMSFQGILPQDSRIRAFLTPQPLSVPQIRHDGGFVGNIEKFHSGGFVGDLKSSEVPAVLESGEYVIQKSAVAALGTNFLDKINSSSAIFSPATSGTVALGSSPVSNSSVIENNYNLSFQVDGGNIDEQKLAQKVMFEIKKVERNSGGGRRIMS